MLEFDIYAASGAGAAVVGALWKLYHGISTTKIKHEKRLTSIESTNSIQELKIDNLEKKQGSTESRIERMDETINGIRRDITEILTILKGRANEKNKNMGR